MTAWPPELPDYMLRDGYADKPGEGALRTPMDAGPAKLRRRFTAVVDTIRGQLSLTREQTEVLDSFYLDDLGGGTGKFDWVHPRTRADVEFRFVSRPTYSPDGSNFLAQIELEILP